jgi:hypothetical protein
MTCHHQEHQQQQRQTKFKMTNNINIESIPSDTLEMVENFAPSNNTRKYPSNVFVQNQIIIVIV